MDFDSFDEEVTANMFEEIEADYGTEELNILEGVMVRGESIPYEGEEVRIIISM